MGEVHDREYRLVLHNPIVDSLLDHKSIRRYTDEMPSDEVLETVVRAGQQAPFASQLYSVIHL